METSDKNIRHEVYKRQNAFWEKKMHDPKKTLEQLRDEIFKVFYIPQITEWLAQLLDWHLKKKKKWIVIFSRGDTLRASNPMTKQCAIDVYHAIDDSLFITKIIRKSNGVYKRT